MKLTSKNLMLGAFASVAILTHSATAAEWHRNPPSLRFSGTPQQAATAYLRAYAPQLRIDGIDLQPRRVLALRNLHTVRYQQKYHGLPVYGKMSAVRVGPSGVIRVAVVDVARGLSVPPVPTVDATQALGRVADRLGVMVDAKRVRFELGVLPYEEQGGVLVWHIDLMQSHGPHRFVVDAHAGVVIQDYPLSVHATGRVYDIDPEQTPTLVERELIGLDPGTPTTLTGFEGNQMVYGYVSGDNQIVGAQTAVPTDGDNFLYDPNPDTLSIDDPFGEVMGYYHAARMRDYFETTLGLDMTGPEYSLAVVTSFAPSNNPTYIENAFYAPWDSEFGTFPGDAKNLICLGRGVLHDFAYDSDVLLHEYTHYISQNALDFAQTAFYDQYGFLLMPGSINEGTADYFSSTMNNDPVVASYALRENARDLEEFPGKCPDDVVGEVHADGRLIGSAGWAIRKVLGAELADEIVWGSMSLLNNSASLGNFGDGVLQSAQDLGLDSNQMDQIKTILTDRGLDDCDRILEINNQNRTTHLDGLDVWSQFDESLTCQKLKDWDIRFSSLFQFVYTPNEYDTEVELKVDLNINVINGNSDELDWNIYVRRNEMVSFELNQDALLEVNSYDYAEENIVSPYGSIVIDENSDPPFDPKDQYFLIIEHQNCPTVTAVVGAISKNNLPDDAGPDAQEAGPDAQEAGPDAQEAGPDAQEAGPDAQDAKSDGRTPGRPDASTELDAQPDGQVGSETPPLDPGQPGGGCNCATSRRNHPLPAAAGVIALALGWLARRRRRRS